MTFRLLLTRALLAAASGLLFSSAARAASLQPVSDWDTSGVPSTVSMYIYVPDNLAANPPILVLAHFCGGTASAVFGQAQGGGIVAAADQFGFIMVVPQAANPDGSGRCWDVGSTQALARDGGGDTQAIIRMVDYAVNQYDANRERVYVTGDSSGGMMTEALLALYPDVFRAGAAFAGVPAGCWAVSNPDGSWSGPCAGGMVTHTPEEWRDLVEGMYPGYTGPRPRVQLFHGDADDIISYTNHEEAIKQWTAVLGLSESPTSTEVVQLGTHQATRQSWESTCGYVVLDAFTSMGGDHGPSDALFEADFVIPFLGLDQAGASDPEVEQCGDSNGSGATDAGSTVTAGTITSSTAASVSGSSSTGGGAGGAGGSATTSASTDGNASSTGSVTTGSQAVTGGSMATGSSSTSSSAGGASSSAGSVATTEGLTGGGTRADAPPTGSSDQSGCSCRAAGERRKSLPFGGFAVFSLLALFAAKRKRGGRAEPWGTDL